VTHYSALISRCDPPHDFQVTARDLAVLNASGVSMEQLIKLALFFDFSVCGGAILVDGG